MATRFKLVRSQTSKNQNKRIETGDIKKWMKCYIIKALHRFEIDWV